MKTKHPILVQLGETIRSERKRLEMSQEELAFASGLDRSYMGGVERGERNVAVLNLCRIAKALKISPCSLLEKLEY